MNPAKTTHSPKTPAIAKLRIFATLATVVFLAASQLFTTPPTNAAYGEAPPDPRESAPFNPDFYNNDHWYDSKAEVNLYDMTQTIYGQSRTATEASLLFVNEAHHADTMVKADNWREADIQVVKLNWTTEVPTGIYTYRQMASLFIDRKDLTPFRQSFTHHEWCGNTWKDLRRTGKKLTFKWDSYFDKQASGSANMQWTGKRTLAFADALPALVRTLPFEMMKGDFVAIDVVDTLRSGHSNKDDAQISLMTLAVEDGKKITVPAGEFDVWKVTVAPTNIDGRIPEHVTYTYHVEKAHPHRLIAFTLADGSDYKLRKSTRLAYWSLGKIGDEKYRQGKGVE